jgi:IclR family mhp operon transcriptional activator
MPPKTRSPAETTAAAGSYHTVAGLTKGLALLKTLALGGENTALGLARDAGIPRPTVHRLLETLKQAGYVEQEAPGRGYRLTSLVKTLADGYKDDDWVFGAAGPVLATLRKTVYWPTDVAICIGGWMVVCASTHDMNPLSLDRVVRGRRIAMTTSSLGRAYLAFCPPVEREAILQSLRPHNELERQHLASPELFQRELQATRERGYALRVRGSQPKTCSIAVPVMYQEWVVACVNIHWIARALKPEVAIARYLGHLQQAAQDLADAYAVQAEGC